MRIGELARAPHVSVRALCFHEEQGLLSSTRTAGGQRDYTDDAVDRVRFFQQMFAAGLPSRRIAELLPCIDTGTPDSEQRRMLGDERVRIDERIAQLITARGLLDGVIAAADRAAASA